MIIKRLNGLKWLEFELLSEYPVIHGCLTRHGGCSMNLFESLNFSTQSGDSSKNVRENMQRLGNTIKIPDFVMPSMRHQADIVSISHPSQDRPICDAISTRKPNIGLMISQADCQAAIFYDPVNHVLANSHCGWRGNVHNIYRSTIMHMQKTYNSKAKDLLVCISPSLGPDYSEFIHYQDELPKSFWKFQVKPNYFDLWSISEWQLTQEGIQPDHIQIAKIDTYSCGEDYFSYRRSNICGRQVTVCALI